MILVGFLTMLLCSTNMIAAAPSNPVVRLPTQYVTMRAVYGTESWFEMTLSDIPPGFDITNGTYQGWCVHRNIRMTRNVNHTVILYSSYDPSLPTVFQNGNWDKINYLLNHKRGSRESIQKAIWFYTENENCSSDADAFEMVADAEQNGSGFIPQSGEAIALPIEGIKTIQPTFLELVIPPPGDVEGLAWYDSNMNGVQENGEPGIPDVNVRLFKQDDSLVNETITNEKGYYSFVNVSTGEYYIQFILPAGYKFSPQNVGSDDAIDSDVDPTTGKTIVFIMQADEGSVSWDAGMYIPSSGPSGPSESGYSLNHAPTADGTAGEPYRGFVHEEITFDGSRSYDRDGRIISWRWNFGDGMNGTGEIAKHVYNLPGNYTVILKVTDNKFATDYYTTTAVITLGNNPPTTPIVSGPTSGHMNVSCLYTVVSTDPDGNSLRYVFDWGDGSRSTSPLFMSGHYIYTMHRWSAAGFYTMRVYAQDPSNATSEASEMIVSIDVLFVQNLGYLINVDSVGSFDLFYCNETGKQTRVREEQSDVYAIDTNGDGRFDFQYNVRTGVLSVYPEHLEFEYLMLLVATGIAIIVILLIPYLRIWRNDRVLRHR